MNSVERKRAVRFGTYLQSVPGKQFNIDSVCSTAGKTLGNPLKGLTGGCGTTACAIGHLPAFNRVRFKFVKVWSADGDDELAFQVEDIESNLDDYLDIGMDYFGLTEAQADWLFSPWSYDGYKKVTAKTVARRLLGLANKDKRVLKEFEDACGE